MNKNALLSTFVFFTLFLFSGPVNLWAEQKLFWVSFRQTNNGNQSYITKSDINGNNKQVIVDSANGTAAPYSIAIDDINQKIYWTNAVPRAIMRSNFDGTGIETVINLGNEAPIPFYISIDPLSQQVFWTDLQHNLSKINTNSTGLITRKIARQAAIAAAPGTGANILLYSDFFDGGIFKLPINDITGIASSFVSEAPFNALGVLHKTNEAIWHSTQNSGIYRRSFIQLNPVLAGALNPALNTPFGIVADEAEQNVFWTDTKRKAVIKMSLSNPNPMSPQLTVVSESDTPAGIALSCGFFAPDSDNDGAKDCSETCALDPLKQSPGICGCGIAEATGDSDSDGIIDCLDQCPGDSKKSGPGPCGCGLVENLNTNGSTSCDAFRILTNDTKISLPPTVIIKNRNIRIVFEKFLKALLKKKKNNKRSFLAVLSAKNTKITYRYKVNLRKTSSKTKDIKVLTTKRNELSLKNLSPGNYSVNYKAEILKDGKVASSTNKSPTTEFTIN